MGSKRISSFFPLVVLIAANANVSLADSTGNSLHISARVVATCRVDVNFAIDPESSSASLNKAYDASDDVNWSCTNGAVPKLSITEGGSLGAGEISPDSSAFSNNPAFQSYTETTEANEVSVVDVTLEF